jgi:N-acyl-D-aspartate/D-glutamate deacylase
VREGLRANLVVFDPARVADRATFEDPLQWPLGVRDVLVGGACALRHETVSATRAGMVVK